MQLLHIVVEIMNPTNADVPLVALEEVMLLAPSVAKT
jgi:hypothetical protein